MDIRAPIRMHCAATWLLVGAVLPLFSAGSAAAGVVAPPMATTLVGVCRDQPCLKVLPEGAPASAQAKPRKRVTRRST